MTYHILNGDALDQQLPAQFTERVIFRECLIEGPVSATVPEAIGNSKFWQQRAEYIRLTYDEDGSDYNATVIPEIKKLSEIPVGAKVYLWFEDDLFCQVNFWFIMNYLERHASSVKIFLVRPWPENPYGFGGMKGTDFIRAFKNAQPIKDTKVFADIWEVYRSADLKKLIALASSIEKDFPFVKAAVAAHLDRIPRNGSPGRPLRTLKAIITEQPDAGFGPVFQEFCRREAIYGYGDLQVKRMWDQLKNTNPDD